MRVERWRCFCLFVTLRTDRELEAAAQGAHLPADFYSSMLLLMLLEGEVGGQVFFLSPVFG